MEVHMRVFLSCGSFVKYANVGCPPRSGRCFRCQGFLFSEWEEEGFSFNAAGLARLIDLE